MKIIIKHGEEVADMYFRAKKIMGKRVKMGELKWILNQYDKYYILTVKDINVIIVS